MVSPASSQLCEDAVTSGPIQQKWALVVGIGRFSDAGIPRLNYTTADGPLLQPN
jgi:hypothetical protein